MRFPRASGVLLHPTCFPGSYGVGELGSEAFGFIDFLKGAGQKMWQVLPLNATGYGDSPFQCFSAGNHLLISLEKLKDQGILEASDLHEPPDFPHETVDFGSVIRWKMPLLKKAAARFFMGAPAEDRRAFDDFCARNADWLPDFAFFMALKAEQHGLAWNLWPAAAHSRRSGLGKGPSEK